MRTLDIRCDACGVTRHLEVSIGAGAPQACLPETWWNLDDAGATTRTGTLDFCSLACVVRWCMDPEIRARYAIDFLPQTDGKAYLVNVPGEAPMRLELPADRREPVA